MIKCNPIDGHGRTHQGGVEGGGGSKSIFEKPHFLAFRGEIFS